MSKENIKINAYESTLDVRSDDPQRKYHEVIELPAEADVETARSTYKNGILEIVFDRRKESKPKGKNIKIE